MGERDFMGLPDNLPAPMDDGACDHLEGMAFPSIALPATTGGNVDLSRVPGRAVVFVYPRTGRPGEAPLVEDWDNIPGARGCTPQTCGFRDLHAEFAALHCRVYGLSTQTTEYQKEMTRRLGVLFPVLSDSELKLAYALGLPTFEVASQVLLKRLVMVLDHGKIVKVFYPVFPPDKSAENVLHWMRHDRQGKTDRVRN
ncbi:MAG: peroxiredoxin [Terriglobales bacterium]